MRFFSLLAALVIYLTYAPYTLAANDPLPIPTGKWGINNTGKPDCARPAIEFTPTTIIYYVTGGKGICKIASLKKNNDTYYKGKTSPCNWDKSVPDGEKEGPDGDDNAFSIKLTKKPNEILFNNLEYAFCGDGR